MRAYCSLVTLIVLGMLLSWGASVDAKAGRTEFRATLSGTGKGKAIYRVDGANRKVSVEVENLRSLAGARLNVFAVVGNKATPVSGFVVTTLGTGKLELETQRNQVVPVLRAGDRILVKNGLAIVQSGNLQ